MIAQQVDKRALASLATGLEQGSARAQELTVVLRSIMQPLLPEGIAFKQHMDEGQTAMLLKVPLDLLDVVIQRFTLRALMVIACFNDGSLRLACRVRASGAFLWILRLQGQA